MGHSAGKTKNRSIMLMLFVLSNTSKEFWKNFCRLNLNRDILFYDKLKLRTSFCFLERSCSVWKPNQQEEGNETRRPETTSLWSSEATGEPNTVEGWSQSCCGFGLTAVVDRFRHDGFESSGKTTVAVGEERREHEPNHAEVHFFSLEWRCIADQCALVVCRDGEKKNRNTLVNKFP